MCAQHQSESRAQTFMFHTRPSPICGVDYVKLQSYWLCDESEKEFLSKTRQQNILLSFVCAHPSSYIFMT
jgi:hypothetical protein